MNNERRFLPMAIPHLPAMPADAGRRRCLKAAAAVLGASLLACTPPEPMLRIGSNGWPGYLFLSWAADSGLLPSRQVRMLRISSSVQAMRALSAGMLDGACLTLDEVLSALSEGIPLKVVAVLDVSHGADVVLGQAGVNSLLQLAGRRIGVEDGAVGAVMLDALLQQAGLRHDQVQLLSLPLGEHEAAFERGAVDVLVTMEPHASRLRAKGANLLFSSADIPGRIIDVLAVHEDVLRRSRHAVQALVTSHFAMLARYAREPQAGTAYLAAQMGVPHGELGIILGGMRLPGRAENRQWLAGRLEQEANSLAMVMRKAGLLQRPLKLGRLAVSDFIGED